MVIKPPWQLAVTDGRNSWSTAFEEALLLLLLDDPWLSTILERKSKREND